MATAYTATTPPLKPNRSLFQDPFTGLTETWSAAAEPVPLLTRRQRAGCGGPRDFKTWRIKARSGNGEHLRER